jgi:hypothetical protein
MAVALPMPLDEPVTTTTLFLNFMFVTFSRLLFPKATHFARNRITITRPTAWWMENDPDCLGTSQSQVESRRHCHYDQDSVYFY